MYQQLSFTRTLIANNALLGEEEVYDDASKSTFSAAITCAPLAWLNDSRVEPFYVGEAPLCGACKMKTTGTSWIQIAEQKISHFVRHKKLRIKEG